VNRYLGVVTESRVLSGASAVKIRPQGLGFVNPGRDLSKENCEHSGKKNSSRQERKGRKGLKASVGYDAEHRGGSSPLS